MAPWHGQPGRDLVDRVERSVRHGDDTVVCLVIRQRQPPAIDAPEGDDAGQGKSLIADDQGAITRQRMQRRRGLGARVRVSISAERDCLRPR